MNFNMWTVQNKYLRQLLEQHHLHDAEQKPHSIPAHFYTHLENLRFAQNQLTIIGGRTDSEFVCT